MAGRVVAVEPDPVAREELVANAVLNPELEAHVHVYSHCVHSLCGKAAMKGDPGGSWSSILFKDDHVSSCA